MSFPHISEIAQFQSSVSDTKEIKQFDIGNNTTSFCYMISGEDTFKNEWLRECRGITFNSAGKISSRPMHKFFNVGEREETRIENIDWTQIDCVMDKLDGSMIHTVNVDGQVMLKSKKTFNSSVALDATKWMLAQPNQNIYKLCKAYTDMGYTVTFEWTDPCSRIVILYDEPKLTLLHIRDNVTGEYATYSQLKQIAGIFDVPLVARHNNFLTNLNGKTIENHLKYLVENTTGVEGWVIKFKDGNMVKLKTDWYLNLHRSITFIRERDIAKLVIDESLDDIKTVLLSNGVDISEILQIEKTVVGDIVRIEEQIEQTLSANKDMPRKDFAIKFKDFDNFGLLMAAYCGKEPDVKSYYSRNILDEKFSLRPLKMNDV